jgi:16S rRNA (cytosine967-C5)-methyltransferase
MPVRAAAARAVASVVAGRALETALAQQRGPVAPREHGLLQEIAFGTVRHWYRLEPAVRRRLRKPLKRRDRDLLALLVAGAYELDVMRTPDHAAVDAWVEASQGLGKPWARGLVNGVLRGLLRAPAALAATGEGAVDYGWPEWLANRLAADWPADWPRIAASGIDRPPMTLRVNRRRYRVRDYLDRLAADGLAAQRHGAAPDTVVLDEPVPVERLPGFDAGAVSVQDAGAQLAAPALGPRSGERILDACAAPGGKTGHLAEIAPDIARLVAVEADPDRGERLRAGLQRLGVSAELRIADAAATDAWWDGVAFDRIVLDVPCSATGVIRRHPDIRLLRRPEDIAALVQHQARLLDAVWPLLAPGGMLLYASCSILRCENADQVASFLERTAQAGVAQWSPGWGRADGPGRQILPGEEGMDGLFYALLHRFS